MQKKTDKKRRLEDKISSTISIIAPGTKFKGTIKGHDTLLISGHFEGKINCEGLIRVDKEGSINGTINSPYIIIEGKINGDIESAEHVELRNEARMTGNINTSKIVMAEGCLLQGDVNMPSKEDKPYIFVEKRKSVGHQDKPLSPKGISNSQAKSRSPRKQKPH